MKQCPNCQAYWDDSQTNCPNCGTPLNPVPYQQPDTNDLFAASGPEGKSRGVAAILALLVGGLGVHYFYCGKVAGGLICLALCLVTCGLWELLVFVQGIMFFVWTNREFEEKFVATDKTFPLF